MNTTQKTLLAAFAICAAASAGELVVEPNGLSPHAALERIRAAKASGDASAWTVRVKPGVYVLKEPLKFLPRDSGTPDAPVEWIGESGAKFAGGERLTGWKDAGGGVWSAPIPKSPDGRPAYFEQLWVNGRRSDRARMPNRNPDNRQAEYFRIAEARQTAVTNAAGKVEYFVERGKLAGDGAEALKDVEADEMQYAQMGVVVKWSFARRILRGVDPATLTCETHSKSEWKSWKTWTPATALVCFENVRGAFDAPGEWFYDAKAGAVLYRPLPGEDMATAEVFAPSSEISRLVELEGRPDAGEYVHDVAFRGIEFAYTAATGEGKGPTQSDQLQAANGSDGAIMVEGARRVVFDGCTVSHTGNYGMRFNDGCTSNTVANCRMADLGAGGIWMGARTGHVAKGEVLSRRVINTLAPRSTAFNRVENCTIRGGGRFNPEGTGVAFTHVSDSKVRHCEISDFYYTGVSVGWQT